MRAVMKVAGLTVMAVTAQLAACGDDHPATISGGAGDNGGLGSAGGSGGTGGTTGTGSSRGWMNGWTELSAPMMSVSGGRSSVGRGSAGGAINMRVGGQVAIDPTLQPAIPAAPADGAAVDASALASDVASDGSIRISGMNAVGGGDATRRITSNAGDIVIDGTLRAADAGAARQGIVLSAPNGVVFVSGTVDTSGADNGQAAGTIEIVARQVVVTGKLLASGGNGTDVAGPGGAVTITSSTDAVLTGFVRFRGGAVSGAATGGAAATLRIDAAGLVQLAGTIDGRGGSSSGGDAGAAGAIRIGDSAAPSALQVMVPIVLNGGEGAAGGGTGGALMIDAAGTLTLAGSIRADGGAVATGGAMADGGTAGSVVITITSVSDPLNVTPSGEVTLDGGAAGGAGVAGGGGHLLFVTNDGSLSMAGKLFGRGGAAPDPGGIGGLGGHVNLFTDNNHNGLGGNMTIETTGVIDVSGGAGTIGGAARNNGGDGVAFFPEMQEQIAVLLNADGIHGTPPAGNATILNMGRIIARGGAADGWGGDVDFHGNGENVADAKDPVSGPMELKAAGSGRDGDFFGD
jgi:hypothetical protein